MKSWYGLPMNCGPLSLTIMSGFPNMANVFFVYMAAVELLALLI